MGKDREERRKQELETGRKRTYGKRGFFCGRKEDGKELG